MAFIRKLPDREMKIAENVFLAENCAIIGEVEIGEGSSIWYSAVLRGDVHYIKVGKDVNIQDNVVVHCTYKKYPTNIKDRVSIGHSAVIHGCTIEEDVLIGMGAIIMDNVVVGSNSVIAAGSVVVPNTIVEPNSVYAGVPAKKIKDIDDKLSDVIKNTTINYKKYVTWYEDKE
ncbi:MAG: gamma carbonic anhydrase family protein [Bacteroidales bacterium]|nr:gamma carbonic anhydrase family protein [Bacteroidales bacterium]